MNSRYVIIGCGGVGSWLLPSLALLVKAKNILVIDGDSLERKNLNRQLFSEADIGSNKAQALGNRYKVQFHAGWFSLGGTVVDENDWLMVCVDNNAARLDALKACDMSGAKAIFAANETYSSEAYVYLPEWRGSQLDPRVYYPEIESSLGSDPRARSAGCTGEAQEANRQLVSANFMAAALAQHMAVLWSISVPDLDPEVLGELPYRMRANMSKLEQSKVKEAEPHLYETATQEVNPA